MSSNHDREQRKYTLRRLVTTARSTIQTIKIHILDLTKMCNNQRSVADIERKKLQLVEEDKDLKRIVLDLTRLKQQAMDDEKDDISRQLQPLFEEYKAVVDEFESCKGFVNTYCASTSLREAPMSYPSSSLYEADHPPRVIELQGGIKLMRVDSEHDIEESESMVQLERDVNDLTSMFGDLLTQTRGQKEALDRIENNLSRADAHLNEGVKNIIEARKLQAASIPVAGALIGGVILGPVGVLIGLKGAGIVGALVGLGVGGLTGAAIKKKYNKDTRHLENEHQELTALRSPLLSNKKDD